MSKITSSTGHFHPKKGQQRKGYSIFHNKVLTWHQAVADKHGVNILMEACQHSQREIVEHLIQFPSSVGLNPEDTDELGRNALFYLGDHDDTGQLYSIYLSLSILFYYKNTTF